MNVILVNPCRPFEGMHRKYDYMEILKNSLADSFGLNDLGRACVDEAIHQAFSEKDIIIASDIAGKINEFRISGYYPEMFCFELCKKLQCMTDSRFPEYAIFCERNGIPINSLDVVGLRALMSQASNTSVRELLGRLINYSLMF